MKNKSMFLCSTEPTPRICKKLKQLHVFVPKAGATPRIKTKKSGADPIF
jgi:hypothetical protein